VRQASATRAPHPPRIIYYRTLATSLLHDAASQIVYGVICVKESKLLKVKDALSIVSSWGKRASRVFLGW
jgi:hypothetical protein